MFDIKEDQKAVSVSSNEDVSHKICYKYEKVDATDYEKSNNDYDMQKRDQDIDENIDSHDEGLGDISSESEIAGSPAPNESENANNNNNDCEDIHYENQFKKSENQGKLLQNLDNVMKRNKSHGKEINYLRVSIETPL